VAVFVVAARGFRTSAADIEAGTSSGRTKREGLLAVAALLYLVHAVLSVATSRRAFSLPSLSGEGRSVASFWLGELNVFRSIVIGGFATVGFALSWSRLKTQAGESPGPIISKMLNSAGRALLLLVWIVVIVVVAVEFHYWAFLPAWLMAAYYGTKRERRRRRGTPAEKEGPTDETEGEPEKDPGAES
jgi:hypothetical protein